MRARTQVALRRDVSKQLYHHTGARDTYVIRDIATEEQNRANMDMMPEIPAPRRPQQAMKPVKKARVSKNRVIRMKTQPNRHKKNCLFDVVSPARLPTSELGALRGFESQARPMTGAARAPSQSLLPAPQM